MTNEEFIETLDEPIKSEVRQRLRRADNTAWEAHKKFLRAIEEKQQQEARANEAESKLASSGEHCATCICGRRAPVQSERGQRGRRDVGDGSVSWEEHLLAYADYAKRYGHDQTAERMAQRGGFGYWEMTMHLGHEPKTWKPR